MNGRLVAKPNAMVDTPAMNMKISDVACLSESSPLTNSEASATGAGKGCRVSVRVSHGAGRSCWRHPRYLHVGKLPSYAVPFTRYSMVDWGARFASISSRRRKRSGRKCKDSTANKTTSSPGRRNKTLFHQRREGVCNDSVCVPSYMDYVIATHVQRESGGTRCSCCLFTSN